MAIDFLIKFMFILLCLLSRFSPFVCHLKQSFPHSLNAMRKRFIGEILFSKYPVCPKCTRVYDSYETCLERVGFIQTSKNCVATSSFPSTLIGQGVQSVKHYFSRRCDSDQVKQVYTRIRFTAIMDCSHPYKNILLMRPEFLANCELWKSRPVEDNLLSDMYDGKIWKEFMNVASSPFLVAPFSFGLMLNVDWFQPYTHTVNSVGVIYLVIMNLPHTLRFKPENMILIGIIPGPTEPSHDMNPYLDPLATELLDFWLGVKLQVYSSSGTVEKVVKCALLCICCDLPAARKACGFLSYTAKLGCSRCFLVQWVSGEITPVLIDRSGNQDQMLSIEKMLRC